MRNHRVDAPFVDDMLKTILETLASEGMIALPGGKATLPFKESAIHSNDNQKNAKRSCFTHAADATNESAFAFNQK